MEKIILTENQDAVGWLWFIPDEEFIEGKPCTGWGKERYAEGSVFEGQTKYDGKNFYRQGFGVQNFEKSVYPVDCPDTMRPTNFYGLYDTEGGYPWMHGNGIVYFVDKQTSKPAGFAKGFFSGMACSEWHGEFDYNNLLNGYTKDMEIKLVPFRGRREFLAKKYPNTPAFL